MTQGQQKAIAQKQEIARKRYKKAHPGRAKLPDHLSVEEIEIYPEGDLSEMVCIGKEVKYELECVPARFFIKCYIRYKYAPKSKEGKHLTHIGTVHLNLHTLPNWNKSTHEELR